MTGLTSKARPPGEAFDPLTPVGRKHKRAAYSTGRKYPCAKFGMNKINQIKSLIKPGFPPDDDSQDQHTLFWNEIFSRVESCLVADYVDRCEGVHFCDASKKILEGESVDVKDIDYVYSDWYELNSKINFFKNTWDVLLEQFMNQAEAMERYNFLKNARKIVRNLQKECNCDKDTIKSFLVHRNILGQWLNSKNVSTTGKKLVF